MDQFYNSIKISIQKHWSIIPFLGEDNAFAAVWPVDCGDAEENANVSKEDETVKD